MKENSVHQAAWMACQWATGWAESLIRIFWPDTAAVRREAVAFEQGQVDGRRLEVRWNWEHGHFVAEGRWLDGPGERERIGEEELVRLTGESPEALAVLLKALARLFGYEPLGMDTAYDVVERILEGEDISFEESRC